MSYHSRKSLEVFENLGRGATQEMINEWYNEGPEYCDYCNTVAKVYCKNCGVGLCKKCAEYKDGEYYCDDCIEDN